MDVGGSNLDFPLYPKKSLFTVSAYPTPPEVRREVAKSAWITIVGCIARILTDNLHALGRKNNHVVKSGAGACQL